MIFPNQFGTDPYSWITPNLVIGNLHGLDKLREHNPPSLGHNKITDAINCTPEILEHNPDILTTNVGWDDGYEMPEDKFHHAEWFGKRAINEGRTLMICCHAGISRSPSLTAAILVSLGKFETLEDALAYIKRRRMVINPAPAVLIGMKKHLRLFPYNKGWN
jgi:hypothetical protein